MMNSLEKILASVVSDEKTAPDLCLTRRNFLVGSFFAALLLGMAGNIAEAGKINPLETQVTLPDEITWVAWPGPPPTARPFVSMAG